MSDTPATWTPAVKCNLNDDGPQAFVSAVRRFREWAANQPLVPLRLTTGWCVITPELAEELLKRNRRNRKIRYHSVVQYAHQMLNKRWKKTGEPVIITDRGEVDDAGHRLLACYFSGASFETFVVTDVPHDDHLFAYIDNGVSRTGEDTLVCAGMNGMSGQIANIIRDFALRYDERTLSYTGRLASSPVTNVDILDYAMAHPDLAETVKLIKDLYPAAVRRLGDIKVAGFIGWKIRQSFGSGELEDYMVNLTKSDLPPGHPIAVLQKRLDDHLTAADAGRRSPKAKLHLTPVQILALAMRAFILAKAGQTIRNIGPNTDDPFPQIETATGPIAAAAE